MGRWMSGGENGQAMRASGVRADPVFIGVFAVAAVGAGRRYAKVLV